MLINWSSQVLEPFLCVCWINFLTRKGTQISPELYCLNIFKKKFVICECFIHYRCLFGNYLGYFWLTVASLSDFEETLTKHVTLHRVIFVSLTTDFCFSCFSFPGQIKWERWLMHSILVSEAAHVRRHALGSTCGIRKHCWCLHEWA